MEMIFELYMIFGTLNGFFVWREKKSVWYDEGKLRLLSSKLCVCERMIHSLGKEEGEGIS